MISDAEKAAISDSWRLVLPIAETASDLFYKKLFELRPDYRRLFPEDMTAQKRKLLAMLSFVVKSLDWPESAWRDTVSEEDDLRLVVWPSAAGIRTSTRSPTPVTTSSGKLSSTRSTTDSERSSTRRRAPPGRAFISSWP